jgi:uncharacterized damage-inducible protein DinB
MSIFVNPSDPVANMYLHQVKLVEDDVLSLARAMPAEKYDFAPTQGAFTGVRTFGEQVRHLATMIYMTAAIVLEEKSPYGPGRGDNGPASITSKDQVLEYLQGSLAYARKAMSSLTNQNQLDTVKTYFGPMARSAVAAGVAYHGFNHYGQMVVYARMNGVVPPSSQPPVLDVGSS